MIWHLTGTQNNKTIPITKLSTDYGRKLKAVNKIKNKYLRKTIGQRNKNNKIPAEWLKTAGYLDTKDQGKINYIFVLPKKVETNDIPGNAGNLIRTEIDSTDFKKENLASKVRKNKIRKLYVSNPPAKEVDEPKDNETDDIVRTLEDIARLEPG